MSSISAFFQIYDYSRNLIELSSGINELLMFEMAHPDDDFPWGGITDVDYLQEITTSKAVIFRIWGGGKPPQRCLGGGA